MNSLEFTLEYKMEDAINFIEEKCNIDKKTIKEVLTLEYDYMQSIGIVDKIEELEEFIQMLIKTSGFGCIEDSEES